MICKNCIHKDICKFSVESMYECEHFADGTIKNQYDRIRNMSVEEMASKIVEKIDCKMCPVKNTCNLWQSCEHEMIEWLESEVTE